MTWEIGLLFGLLAVMVVLFLTEKLPVDLTAFSGLVILVLGGYLGPEEAFSGFSSPAVITMLSIFILSGGLQNTGVADLIGRAVHSLVGDREVPLILTIMAAGAVLSAFMFNIAATAVLMPGVASIARSSGLSPSRLFIPLSFGTILGGTTTLVGTPPNIVAASLLRERNLEPFELFDFTPLGVILVLVGMVFMATVGRRLLPDRPLGRDQGAELAQVYQLNERLFSIRIPENSPLDGVSIGKAQLGTTLEVKVVAVLRDGRRELAPSGETVLSGGDVLMVEGKVRNLQELLQVRDVEVSKVQTGDLPRPVRGVSAIRLELNPGSALAGRTLTELRFRGRFGVVVVAIRRDGEIVRSRLGRERLREGDQVVALGTRAQLDELASHPEFLVRETGLSSVQQLQEQLFLIRIPKDSPLGGQTLGSTRLGELVGLTIAGIVRDRETRLAVSPDDLIRGGDRLLVAGEPSQILNLLEVGEISVDVDVEEPTLESDSVGVAELTIPPRSAVAGKTAADLSFRQRYGVQVLALWREGEPVVEDFAALPFQVGDAVLVQGPREKIDLLGRDPDFLVLSELVETPRRVDRRWIAVGGLALMIALVVTGLQPIHVAAFAAGTLVVLGGALSMQEAYRAIEWRAIFLVAAVLPVGIALERTGAAGLMAQGVMDLAGPAGPYAVMGSLIVLSSLLSQSLDGAPAVVLLAPVAVGVAGQLGVDVHALFMGISLAASVAFMTPFSQKANLLVMGAGGYRSLDYLRVGTPLTIVLLALMVLLVPLFFPL